MSATKSIRHSSTCIYKNCGIRSRDNILNIRFYRLPVTDRERLITWLVNSGCDDLAEESDATLCKLRICSRHFASNAIYPGGRLKKDAEPLLHPIELGNEGSTNLDNVQLHEYYMQIHLLKAQLKRKDNLIKVLKKRIGILTRKYYCKNAAVIRLQKKMRTGNISDETLSSALSQRTQGSLLTFLKMQLFHKKQTSYNDEEKALTKKMHYTWPSLYRKMSEDFGFILPGSSTMKIWFNIVQLWPGISNTMFQALKAKVDCMDSWERNCVLLFDEMRIKKNFDFHEAKQKIEGFQDLGQLGCNATVATSVLVFMVRGLLYNWKQPVAYFLAAGNVHNTDLASAINITIEALLSTGLKVRAIVCDQGTNNRCAIRNRITISSPYLMYASEKIYTVFDVPHIFKCIRNQLLTHDILYDDNKIASWNDVRLLWQLENDKGTRAACKLSEKHVNPNNFERMKCRLALQVFSRRVSAALYTAGTTGEIESETVLHTAEFFKILNDSFDCLNSKSCNDSNANRCALSENRVTVENSLMELLENCSKWRTIMHKNNSLKIPPCFEGLQITLKAILELWNDLKSEEIKFFMTSRVNQDPLENLFSMIRTYGGTYNQNPSAKSFRLLLQKNIVLNLCKSAQSANCLDDDDETLFANPINNDTIHNDTLSSSSFTNDTFQASSSAKINNTDNNNDDAEELIDVEQTVIDTSNINDETLEASAVEYFAGFVAKKCITKSGCERCHALFINENKELTHARQILLFFRAYETNDGEELGHLCVPTAEYSLAFKIMNAIFDAAYPNMRGNYGILDTIFSLMVQAVHMQYAGWFEHETCSSHRKDLAYYMMKVKINKDVVWLGERLRTFKNYSQRPRQKLINIQSS